ncbi:DUF1885 family protein [Paenibacillus doosanensis]|uniref:DUF1885 domain-containing protein n=1 Tax=Paenibacillus konkukensis TaxID=2020716 RepID=A0ABY4S187_9BACL|nr:MULTISPECIES: DUF1885 family protein [Paenibacillus]MCS7459371.1 DUF1885 family protein [Paenibacillus doosanensis]UQZ87164.1 hypothetical protein SK3146_06461 [Paenibacillus konkukensis]
MAQSAYIKFVDGSTLSSLTLDELKEQLLHYEEQLNLTGKQLGWDYGDAGFPYTIETKPGADGSWFYLKGKNALYKYIVMGAGKEQSGDIERNYVQVVLPDDCTHGDKAKGNEFCKYLAKLWKAELHLFNGRIMYFNPRK